MARIRRFPTARADGRNAQELEGSFVSQRKKDAVLTDARKKRTLGQTLYRERYLLLMFLPIAIYYLVFCYLPMAGTSAADTARDGVSGL